MIIFVIGRRAHSWYHYTNGVNLQLQLCARHRGKRNEYLKQVATASGASVATCNNYESDYYACIGL